VKRLSNIARQKGDFVWMANAPKWAASRTLNIVKFYIEIRWGNIVDEHRLR
jgi:hypothetical protein